MTAMSSLARPDLKWQEDGFSRQFCEDKLRHWREQLLRAKAGVINTPSVAECRRQIDTWLDELNEIRGR